MYDLLVIGAGPAGITASIYASRYKISHLVLGNPFESSLAKAHMIENWPGEKSIKGEDLLEKFSDHAKGLGGEFVLESAVSIVKENNFFQIKTNQDKVYESKTVMICSGTKEKKLGVPGEEEFLGRGVSYCAICDGAFFKEKTVAVVGGGNSAIMAALMLSEHANRVYLVHRSEFKCEPLVLERVEKNNKITLIKGVNIKEIKGDKKVQSIVLDSEHEGNNEVLVDGVFIEIGLAPNSVLLKDLGVEIDAKGSIVVDAGGKTNIEGLYAAGDVTNGSNGIRQVLSATSEGMIAVSGVYNFLKNK
jgi:thioredoxin reductase (NADPH)